MRTKLKLKHLKEASEKAQNEYGKVTKENLLRKLGYKIVVKKDYDKDLT